MLKIVDVSSYQGNYSVGSHGEDGVIIKATEGLGYVNPYCDYVAQQAISRGLPWGLYHYANGNNPWSEAQYFIDNVKGYLKGNNLPILFLDWEGGNNSAWGNGAWAAQFISRIKYLTGHQAGIYSGQDGVNQTSAYLSSSAPLWFAGYPTMADVGWNPSDFLFSTRSWATLTGWQFSSNPVDKSLFYVDRNGWNKIAGNTASASTAPILTPSNPSIVNVNVTYQLRHLNGSWNSPVTNFGDGDNGFAGDPNHEHDLLAISVSHGTLKYRVHTIAGWLSWVQQGNINDEVNGCAGNPGQIIDGVQMIYITPNGEPYQQAYYRSQTTQRAGYLNVCCDDGNSIPGFDSWAGIIGEPMDRLQIAISSSNPF